MQRHDAQRSQSILDSIVRAELDEVVRLHAHKVWEEVSAVEGKVLDDQIERVVGVLNTRDRDVANLNITYVKLCSPSRTRRDLPGR